MNKILFAVPFVLVLGACDARGPEAETTADSTAVVTDSVVVTDSTAALDTVTAQ